MTQSALDFSAPPQPPARVRRGKAAQLAALFQGRPMEWIDGMELARIAGQYAWRTRVSDLRRRPWWMTVENRERKVEVEPGRVVTVSEYRYRPAGETLEAA